MYIDTHSKERMEDSICKSFNLTAVELQEKLMILAEQATGEYDYSIKLEEFITEKCIHYPDEVLFFHLSRRLNTTEDLKEGCNLAELLLSRNPFSSFLHDNNIDFKKDDQHINVFFNGNEIDWDKCSYGNPKYIKKRLGYVKGQEDFCFNGFAMKDLLSNNNYVKDLYSGPEFLVQLAICLDCKSVIWNYINRSKYYIYEYKLPISKVIFDHDRSFSDTEKQHFLLLRVLQRLYQYMASHISYMTDEDNPVLMVPDNYTVPSSFYVCKEII